MEKAIEIKRRAQRCVQNGDLDGALSEYLLIESGALDVHAGTVIGLVVETQCNYFAPLAFPDPVVVGIRIARIGSSSVRYELGLFPGHPDLPCAAKGHFVHVYVDRLTRKPVVLPSSLISALETLK